MAGITKTSFTKTVAVPTSQVPTLASRCPRPLVPVPLFSQPQALTRRRVQIPIVDEILQKMEGATVFTEVDLSQGYLQVTLHRSLLDTRGGVVGHTSHALLWEPVPRESTSMKSSPKSSGRSVNF